MKEYLMSESEYSDYKNQILSKSNSRNIHDVAGLLGTLKNCIDLAKDEPENIEIYVNLILTGKSRIYKLINN